MKKFLFVLATMLTLISMNCMSQLAITNQKTKSDEKLLTIRTTYSWLYQVEGYGYVIKISTDNRFDQRYIWLCLGDTPDAAIQTLKDLNNLMENKVASTVASMCNDETIFTYVNFFGKALYIDQQGTAGDGNISQAEVKKVLKYFNYQEF